MVGYSPVKVIPKDLVSTFFDEDFKCFEISKTSAYAFSGLYCISKF